MNLLFSHMRVGKKLRESLALICIFVPTHNTPELIRSKFHNLDYTDFNRRAFVWFIFVPYFFDRKLPSIQMYNGNKLHWKRYILDRDNWVYMVYHNYFHKHQGGHILTITKDNVDLNLKKKNKFRKLCFHFACTKSLICVLLTYPFLTQSTTITSAYLLQLLHTALW